MKLKKIAAVGMAVLMSLSLIACGGVSNNDTSKTEDTAQSDNKGSSKESDDSSGSSDVTLSVMIWDTNQQTGLQKVMEGFTEETGIKTDIQVVTWNEYWTLLQAGAQGGSLPDVFWMHSNESQRYMSNDMLLDLTDRIAQSNKINLTKYPEDITELYAYEGKNYAIPKDYDTIALWYNKTLFDEAGVSYPDESWTWDDFYEAAKKLTDKEKGIYGTAYNTGNNQDGYYNIIYDFGGYIISDDKKTSGYDDPKTIEAMEFVYRLIEEELAPSLESISETAGNVLFGSGKVAMLTQGSWMVPEFSQNEYTKENCDVAVLPKSSDGKRISIYNGLGWAADANGKHTEEAWKLIEYLGSKEAQKKQAELGVTMSAYEGTSDAWANSQPQFNLQAHLDMTENMIIRPYSRSTVTWEDRATELLKQAWTGAKPMADVCKEIAAEMNTILAEE